MEKRSSKGQQGMTHAANCLNPYTTFFLKPWTRNNPNVSHADIMPGAKLVRTPAQVRCSGDVVQAAIKALFMKCSEFTRELVCLEGCPHGCFNSWDRFRLHRQLDGQLLLEEPSRLKPSIPKHCPSSCQSPHLMKPQISTNTSVL